MTEKEKCKNCTNEKEMLEEMAEEILQEFTSCYDEADKDCLKKIIGKYIPKDSVVLTEKEYNELIERPLKAMGELTCKQIKEKK